jgi:hypothetical protein
LLRHIFGKSYSQEYHFPINTYPKQIQVWINGELAANGADYIVDPITPTIKGTYPVVKFDKDILLDSNKLQAFLTKDYSKSFILVDDGRDTDKTRKAIWQNAASNPFKAKGIIMLCDKLTEETSDTVLDYALLYALRSRSFGKATEVTNRIPCISVDVKNKFIKDFTAENLIGYVKGNVQPDTFIVFSAHYDHLGKMGNVYFPGANDNASGVAMLLSLAKYYSQNQPKYSVAFIAFSGEEVALLGSHYYVQHPLFTLGKIKFLVNMDMMGTGDEGIKVVNATIYKKEMQGLVKLNDSLHFLKVVSPRGPSANSDHYFFYKNNVPDFFIYTLGGIKAYHDIYDKRETLPLTEFDNVFKLLIHFTDDICNHRF